MQSLIGILLASIIGLKLVSKESNPNDTKAIVEVSKRIGIDEIDNQIESQEQSMHWAFLILAGTMETFDAMMMKSYAQTNALSCGHCDSVCPKPKQPHARA